MAIEGCCVDANNDSYIIIIISIIINNSSSIITKSGGGGNAQRVVSRLISIGGIDDRFLSILFW